MTAQRNDQTTPAFRRTLSFRALLLFGISFVGPTAPYTMFGLGTVKSEGHFALVYLIATVAMCFTAFSYGRMASLFPQAGSAYTYAGRCLHPLAGYFTGWVMIADYVILPLISYVIIGVTMQKLVPAVPYTGWVFGTAILVTIINLRGIETTSRFTIVWTLVCAVSVIWFVGLAVPALLNGTGRGTLLSVEPFYDPAYFSWDKLLAACPLAILSFIGFDGISTFAEDAHSPEKHTLWATVLTCLICGFLFVSLTYLGQLLWPDWTTFRPVETAFSDIGGLIGGRPLYLTVSALVLGQAFAAAVVGQASASRLFFGMARDGKLPYGLFGYLHPTRNTPTRSIGLMTVVHVAGALVFTLDQAAELINFGACLGFLAVNASVVAYELRHPTASRSVTARWGFIVLGVLGALVCGWLWLNLSRLAMQVGFGWLAVGVLYWLYLRKK